MHRRLRIESPMRAIHLTCLAACLMPAVGLLVASESALHVQIADEEVSVRARDVAVRDLLEDVASQSGLVVALYGSLDERVTMEFYRLPLHEALGRILRSHDFVLRYYSPSSVGRSPGDAALSKLWVFSRGGGTDPVPAGSMNPAHRPGGGGELQAMKAKENLRQLSAALSDADPGVRRKAVSELAGMDGDEPVSILIDVALFDENASVREEATSGLGEIGNDAGMPALEQALADPDIRVREAAVDALADLGGAESARALDVALSDQDSSVRENAVYALAEIGGEVAIAALLQALGDEETDVREAAADMLAELSEEEP